MKAKIEQLIEKYQKNYKEMRLEIPTGEIIYDLQSLQDTTEERECDNCKKLQKELD
jgi:hypothetical protein